MVRSNPQSHWKGRFCGKSGKNWEWISLSEMSSSLSNTTIPANPSACIFSTARSVAGAPQPLDVSDLQWVTPAQLAEFEFPPADAELIHKLMSEQ